MTLFYAFNGDADGLCALQQLRLADPRDATLVTGVKRDIQLLRRVNAAAGDEVTVLDISLDQNRDDLLPAAGSGRFGSLFRPPLRGRAAAAPRTSRRTSRNRPTSARARWSTAISPAAIARGPSSRPSATTCRSSPSRWPRPPASTRRRPPRWSGSASASTTTPTGMPSAISASIPRIWRSRCCRSRIPMEFVRRSPAYARLGARYEEDMQQARALKPARQVPGATMVVLPDEAWARRAIGVLANELTQAQPDCAIAILSPKAAGRLHGERARSGATPGRGRRILPQLRHRRRPEACRRDQPSAGDGRRSFRGELRSTLPHRLKPRRAMDLLNPLAGFLVGVLVGFTGVGGGALMTPLLVFLFGVAPQTAIGTDLLFAADHQGLRRLGARRARDRSTGWCCGGWPWAACRPQCSRWC